MGYKETQKRELKTYKQTGGWPAELQFPEEGEVQRYKTLLTGSQLQEQWMQRYHWSPQPHKTLNHMFHFSAAQGWACQPNALSYPKEAASY